jgi:multisubunit Na+/H+ antiporter MnhE subunit
MNIQYNALEYAHQLEGAGVPQAQAEVHANMRRVLSDCVAAPADLHALRGDLTHQIVEMETRLHAAIKETGACLRGEIAEAGAHLRAEIVEVEARLRGEIVEVEARLRGEIVEVEARLRGEIVEVEARLRGEIVEVEARLRGEIAKTEARLGAKIEIVEARVLAEIDKQSRFQKMSSGLIATLIIGLYIQLFFRCRGFSAQHQRQRRLLAVVLVALVDAADAEADLLEQVGHLGAHLVGVDDHHLQHFVWLEPEPGHVLVVAQVAQAIDPGVDRARIRIGKTERAPALGVERGLIKDRGAVQFCPGHAQSFRSSTSIMSNRPFGLSARKAAARSAPWA